jgi:hypothetical protein
MWCGRVNELLPWLLHLIIAHVHVTFEVQVRGHVLSKLLLGGRADLLPIKLVGIHCRRADQTASIVRRAQRVYESLLPLDD